MPILQLFRLAMFTSLALENIMQPSISALTFGVQNLERSVTFYRDGLGLATQGITGTEFENGAVAFLISTEGLNSPCGR